MSDAPLKQRIRADLTTAMKARDSERTATLRMVIAAIGAEEVSGARAHELTDEQITAVLMRENKKRGESASIYDENGRVDLADRERAEATIIADYLPKPLSDAELGQLVDQVITEVAGEIGEKPSMRHMGRVMKSATAKAAGGVDGKRLSTAVREALS